MIAQDHERLPLRSLAVMAILLAVAGAGAAIAHTVTPVKSHPRSAAAVPVPAGAAPAGPAVEAAAAADAEAGKPAWAVRAYPSKDGRRCLVIGRKADGRIGRLNRDGTMTPFDPVDAGGCGDPDAEPRVSRCRS